MRTLLISLSVVFQLADWTGGCISPEFKQAFKQSKKQQQEIIDGWIARKQQETRLEYPEMSSNILPYLLKVITGRNVKTLEDQPNCGRRNKDLEPLSKSIKFSSSFDSWIRSQVQLTAEDLSLNRELLEPLTKLDNWIPNSYCMESCTWKKNPYFSVTETVFTFEGNNYGHKSTLPAYPRQFSCLNKCSTHLATSLLVQFLPQMIDILRDVMEPILKMTNINDEEYLKRCSDFNEGNQAHGDKCILYYLLKVRYANDATISSIINMDESSGYNFFEVLSSLLSLPFIEGVEPNHKNTFLEHWIRVSLPLMLLSAASKFTNSADPDPDITYQPIAFPQLSTFISTGDVQDLLENFSAGALNFTTLEGNLSGEELSQITYRQFLNLAVIEFAFNNLVQAFISGVNQKLENEFPPPATNNDNTDGKVSGVSSVSVVATSNTSNSLFGYNQSYNYPGVSRYPWVCSLKLAGNGGNHKCAVTLLSVPETTASEEDDDRRPTILVAPAHCNYVCSNMDGQIVETCCCRSDATSCSATPYCGKYPALRKANPSELKIVCGEWRLQGIPQSFVEETEVFLTIKEIVNHPKYKARPDRFESEKDTYSYGPINGYDISVYIVDDSEIKKDLKWLNPACLPKDDSAYKNPDDAYVAGWADPYPLYRYFDDSTLGTYRRYEQLLKETFVKKVICQDPMPTNTYYPAGTRCYNDPSLTACFQFGDSGSPVMHKLHSSSGMEDNYSFAGFLSASKGCDLAELQWGGENPVIFTDAICYMDWIAVQYGMKMPPTYKKPDSCNIMYGSKTAINNPTCSNRLSTQCNWELTKQFINENQFTTSPATEDRCYKYAEVGLEENYYICAFEKDGFIGVSPCNNDCPGVDPNSIVIGGAAVLASAGVSAVTTLGSQAVVMGGVPLGAAVAMGMAGRGQCPPGQCRPRGSGPCCRLIVRNRRRVCPTFC